MSWTQFLPPVVLSIKVAIVTSIIVFLLAAAAARWMSTARFSGKNIVETFLILPLVLPPTVVGFGLLILFGRRGVIGHLYEVIFHGTIVFTWGAAVLASVIVAFPLVYRTMKAGFDAIDPELENSARVIGASEWQVFRYIAMPLSARALSAGCILGFARGLGEFGATLMIAGNIPGRTQTTPTAIFVAVDGGHMALAWALVAAIIIISFVMLLLADRVA